MNNILFGRQHRTELVITVCIFTQTYLLKFHTFKKSSFYQSLLVNHLLQSTVRFGQVIIPYCLTLCSEFAMHATCNKLIERLENRRRRVHLQRYITPTLRVATLNDICSMIW